MAPREVAVIDAWMWSALAIIVVAGAWIFRSEASNESPSPYPSERALPEHEVKLALSEIKSDLTAIQKQLDRIESSQRLENAILAWRKQVDE